MKTFSLTMKLLAGAGAICVSGIASAGVEVSFVQPDRYTDMPFAKWDRDTVMKDLDQYLVKTGAKLLPAGQDLKIEILDIDLAGTLRDSRDGRQIRILNGGADWPKIELRYSLESGGKVLTSGTARLSDMNYFQSHITDHGRSRESNFYEKRMLQDWMKATFVETHAAK